jgi:hypothetical protein
MVTGAHSWKPAWADDRWAQPGKINFQISKLHSDLQIQKGSLPLF